MVTSTAYSQHLADWDQIAVADEQSTQASEADGAADSLQEQEEDLDLLIDPCPSFAGLSADLGCASPRHGSAAESLERIAIALPELREQFDEHLGQIVNIFRDVIADVYAKSFHNNLPTILDNNLAGVIHNIR